MVYVLFNLFYDYIVLEFCIFKSILEFYYDKYYVVYVNNFNNVVVGIDLDN